MAWTSVNPVAVGNITKKSQYDALWDNADYLHATVLGSPNSNSNQPLFTLRKNGSYLTAGTDGSVQFGSASAIGDGASLTMYGETHATLAGLVQLISGGDSVAASVGKYLVRNRYSGGLLDYLTIDNTGITIGQDSSAVTLPILNSQADSRISIFGGTSATDGASLYIEGDDYGGAGIGGAMIARLGTNESFVIQDDTGNARFTVNVDAADTTDLRILDDAGNYDDLLVECRSLYVYDGAAHSNYILLDPNYTTNTARIITDQPILDMSVGQNTIAIPSAAANPGTVMNNSVYLYESGGTRQIRVYLSGTWYKADLTAA